MGTWGQRWRARRFGGGVALLVALAVAALAAGGPGTGPASAGPAAGDPPYSVPTADLAAALDCPATFAHPEHEPVLLVHGTFTAGHEQFAWNYELLLADRGIDACVVTYPDRGLGDMQVSAEYVAYALQEIHRRTGQQVDMVGHSQGATMPRWALKFWPSARAAVDDFVMLAGPNHGTTLADGADTSPTPLYPALYQFDPGSQFVTTLNAGDETPGEIDYSSIYSRLYDELVQPDGPVPTAGLDWGHEDARTKNLAVQDVCPGRLVDHITIGTVDRLTQELVLDAPAARRARRAGPHNPLGALRRARPVRGPDLVHSAHRRVPALVRRRPARRRHGRRRAAVGPVRPPRPGGDDHHHARHDHDSDDGHPRVDGPDPDHGHPRVDDPDVDGPGVDGPGDRARHPAGDAVGVCVGAGVGHGNAGGGRFGRRRVGADRPAVRPAVGAGAPGTRPHALRAQADGDQGASKLNVSPRSRSWTSVSSFARSTAARRSARGDLNTV